MLKLREFIKRIRACKTLDEERCLCNKESAEIRNLKKETAQKLAVRSMTKCMAMSLMGYPTEFIQMTCISLLASPNFTQKRLAYLGICMLLDEKSEILLLCSNIIKKDLGSNNRFVVAAALTTIGEVGTPDMCRDTCPELIKCLNSTNPYIKKKAALALSKVVRSCPELIETVEPQLSTIFEDKNHGVLLSGLALVEQVFKAEPKTVKKYKKYISPLCKYLKNLISSSYAPDYDVNGIADPFLQVRILEVLAHFGKSSSKENEELESLLNSIPSNTDTTRKNTGNSVLYELVRCIFSYDSSKSLKGLGGSILGQFLANKDNNYKYLALNTLNDIAKIDIETVQKHKNVILEFLKDPDIAIKRRSLDLTYLIVNTENIRQIVTETLDFINSTSNVEFKLELTSKIFYSLEKYSPSLKWEIDVLLKMLCLCEDSINDEIVWKITNLILTTKELQQYSMFRYFLAMQNMLEDTDVESLYTVGITILGELFKLIIGVSTTDEEGNTITITEEQIVDLMVNLDKSSDTSEQLRELLMNATFKMIGKLSPESDEKLKKILQNETRSFYPEVQERANEYITFTQIAGGDMQLQITDNIPVPKVDEEDAEACGEKAGIGDEPKIEHKETIVEDYETDKGYRNLINGANIDDVNKGGIGGGISKPKPPKKVKKKEKKEESKKDSLPVEEPIGVPENKVEQPAQPQQQMGGGINLLDDIFGVSSNTNTNTNPPPTANNNNNNDIFSLLGNMGSGNATNTNPQQPSGGLMDLNSIISGGSQPQAAPSSGGSPFDFMNMGNNAGSNNMNAGVDTSNMKEVFKNNDITIYSSLNQNNNVYNGAFYVSNNTGSQINDVTINFLVKKYISCQVLSTSAKDLSPNASMGIKKEVSMTNNDPNKNVVIKLNINYNKEGNSINESKVITL
ncbi:MAG: AP-1 complex subunit gamma [archaeon]|nr:AP-1 complex subunit gamma [archaeon]